MSHHMTLIYYQCRKFLIEQSDLRNGLRHYERSMVIAWEKRKKIFGHYGAHYEIGKDKENGPWGEVIERW